MKRYQVIADYGPVATNHIRFYIEARDEAAAMRKAVTYVKKNYDHLWDRIGTSNIHLYEW